MDKCRYCKDKKSFRLTNFTDGSAYTGSLVSLSLIPYSSTDTDIVIKTDTLFSQLPLWLEVSSTNAYCSTYFAGQKIKTDFEICGDEKVLVANQEVPVSITKRWRYDVNFEASFASDFSVSEPTNCKIVRYELWPN